MDVRLLLVVVAVVLALGYRVYGRFTARVLGVDPSRTTPAHSRNDGVDYVPARHWLVLFGHHFSSICAAGPIVGPALAVAYWGWAPSLLWILIGGVLMGAVADFASLHVAVRHGGVSIGEVTARVVTPRARLMFSLFIFLALILVLAVFSVLTAGTFEQAPEIVLPSWGILPVAALFGAFVYGRAAGRRRLPLATVLGLGALVLLLLGGEVLPLPLPRLFGLEPASLWVLLLLGYCFLASVLPVQYLLQPRDYLSSFVLFAVIAAGLLGALLTNPPLQAAATRGFLPEDWPMAGPLWPMLFVTIACGAISGFHSVVASGTTCRQLADEAHACRIGYGAMLLESLVAVLVVVAVGAGLGAARHGELLRQPGGAITAFGEGYGNLTQPLFGRYGQAMAIMGLNFFMLTTLDTATRLARYLLQEITGMKNRYLPTLVVVGLTAPLALSGQWRKIWPVFGASNQLLGALALLVVSCWLLQRGRRCLSTLLPSLALLVTTIGALGWQVYEALQKKGDGGVPQPDWLIAGIDVVLVLLALFVLAEALAVLRGRRPAPAPAE